MTGPLGEPLGTATLQAYLQQLLSQTVAVEPLNVPYHLVSFTSSGRWTPAAHAVPSGYEVDYYVVTAYGGGDGGARGTGGGPGGRNGGRIVRRLSPDDAGMSQSVTVGAGGSGATSDGFGAAGGVSRFGTLVESVPDASAVPTLYGDVSSSAAPGDGGDGGATIVWRIANSTDNTSGSGLHSHGITAGKVGIPGGRGESTSGAAGGAAGRIGSGWWGSTTAPTAGSNGVTRGYYTTGGGGGGGGGGNGNGSGQAGANGGVPGGGGGGGGSDGGGTIYSAGNGGNGARGQVDVLAVFKQIIA